MNYHTIRAAVCREFGEPLSVEELRIAPPTDRQVRIKVTACSICHSDLTYMDGGWGGELPVVFGHEVSGTVLDAGRHAPFVAGQRVIATLLRSCGVCATCEKGAPFQCDGDFSGTPHLFDNDNVPVFAGLKTGGFAEQIVVDHSQVAVIPDSLPFAEASLLACGVITGWGAVINTAKVPTGATVVVVGCGGVGFNCLQGAKNAGAAIIVALDTVEEKRRLALQFGATHMAANGDEAMRIVNGCGFDYVFMAAGSARATEVAAELVAKLGALVLVGMPPSGQLALLDTLTIANDHKRVLGAKMGGARLRVDIPRLIALHEAGQLKLTELVGEKFPLEHINDAIATSRQGGTLRCVVSFD